MLTCFDQSFISEVVVAGCSRSSDETSYTLSDFTVGLLRGLAKSQQALQRDSLNCHSSLQMNN